MGLRYNALIVSHLKLVSSKRESPYESCGGVYNRARDNLHQN